MWIDLYTMISIYDFKIFDIIIISLHGKKINEQ